MCSACLAFIRIGLAILQQDSGWLGEFKLAWRLQAIFVRSLLALRSTSKQNFLIIASMGRERTTSARLNTHARSFVRSFVRLRAIDQAAFDLELF